MVSVSKKARRKRIPKAEAMKRCSCTFSPTLGRSTLGVTPMLASICGLPMPENSRIYVSISCHYPNRRNASLYLRSLDRAVTVLNHALYSHTSRTAHLALRMTSRFARAVYVFPSCTNSTPDATTSPVAVFSSLNKTLVTGEETTT